MEPLRVLAIEPYYGGSHKAFLDGWSGVSRHRWTLLTLPPYRWKWRMRHGALTLAEEAADRAASGEGWDVLVASDMLNLAEFRGLSPPEVASLPAVVYFHENQLTYPVRREDERDLHFAFTNLTTALAARAVWFNSAFHREELFAAIPPFLKRMPDRQPNGLVAAIRGRSAVWPQGIRKAPERPPRRDGPLRILWAARWEFDKNPTAFFSALVTLAERGVDFRLNVVGQQFRQAPEVFAEAREVFADRIDRWGHQETREAYEEALVESDVVVSTADHEFFGVSVVEAIAAGCFPLLPERLTYPEILAGLTPARRRDFFYDGSVVALASRLEELYWRLEAGDLWRGDPDRARLAVAPFEWSRLGPRLDEALAAAVVPPVPPGGAAAPSESRRHRPDVGDAPMD
jgi:glycosyltransferase involved in cell wall biosynthesis